MQVGLPDVNHLSGEQVVFQPGKKQETMMGKLKKRDFTNMVSS
jgi:hypothetical protein